jgi:hypothetical protein
MTQPFSFDLRDTLSFSVIEGYSISTDSSMSDVADQLKAQWEYYDFSGNVKIPPGHPNYIPTLAESKLQDTMDLLSQENSIYALSLVAGVSLIVLSYMIIHPANS